jgi:guanylate kinase
MDIEQLITKYTPPIDAIETIKHAKIALLVGISGAGKDTIKKALLERPGFADIVSHTTRQPRVNAGVPEVDGKDYHFITEEEARGMLEQGEFVEAKYVHGTIYGTSINEVRRASEAGVAITDIDVQGVAEYKNVSNEVMAIFIVPPTYDIWLERLKKRYASEEEFASEWPKRRDSAIAELARALLLPYYHFIINDSLDEAVTAATEIIAHPNDEFHSKDDEARLSARRLLAEIRERI